MRRLVLLLACALATPARPGAGPAPLPQDNGAAGTWQKLLKLQTTASVMHTTAHPDDEHGGVLALLSRGRGARVSLLTLTRGEAGDNAIGPELFDAVGLIRTEELLVAGRYYGVDRQYFTTVADYGFSKRLDEAIAKWGRDAVLRDMVEIIRMDRPLVVVARFQGNERDGHGNHQAAGLLTQEAFRAAGDPATFRWQLNDGVRPWQPLKLYMGGVRENEEWNVRTNAGEYSPWLGDSYQDFARVGLSFQRSQNGGRVPFAPGPAFAYYKLLAAVPEVRSKAGGAGREDSFFDGIDTSLRGLFTAIRRPAPPAAAALLGAIDAEVKSAVAAFSLQNPSACVPALARGLAATRTAIERLAAEPDAVFVLKVKERQFADAIDTALGLDFQAIADVPGPVVPGQRVAVGATLSTRAPVEIVVQDVRLATRWPVAQEPAAVTRLHAGESVRGMFDVTVPANAEPTRPYFTRWGIDDPHFVIEWRGPLNDEHKKPNQPGFLCALCAYCVDDCYPNFRPSTPPALTAVARYAVAGVPVETRTIVRRRELRLPYGEELRELAVVPAVAVNVSRQNAIVNVRAGSPGVDVVVEVVNNATAGSAGVLALRLPDGWTSSPVRHTFDFSRAGERTTLRFRASADTVAAGREYLIRAVATVAGREHTLGYDVLEHRDLETRYLYRYSSILVRGVDVAIAPNLKIGYVMGIGDEVPAGIAQLGAAVTLLGEPELARGDLRQYDVIVTGTRAYAVRDDLKTYNRRLLEYVKEGGNMIVLYNTQELVPNEYAPYPGVLTARAEEVSEEDSPVAILAPAHRAFNAPNRITAADFSGWVEQRGSKFWSEWDAAYTPMIETHDTGQPPQRGGWLTADYGKGHYTYFAYAFHRQLPYGVPGAYRLLANLLSLGK